MIDNARRCAVHAAVLRRKDDDIKGRLRYGRNAYYTRTYTQQSAVKNENVSATAYIYNAYMRITHIISI